MRICVCMYVRVLMICLLLCFHMKCCGINVLNAVSIQRMKVTIIFGKTIIINTTELRKKRFEIHSFCCFFLKKKLFSTHRENKDKMPVEDVKMQNFTVYVLCQTNSEKIDFKDLSN